MAKLQRQVFAQLKTKPRAEADRLGAVRDVTVGKLLAIERVETECDAVVEQIGLDHRERETARVFAVRHRRLGKETAAEEVAFGNTDFGKRAVGGRITARYREVAGGFFLEIDDENHAIA